MSNSAVKVSVICTAFNHEKLIRSALDGFVMQKTDFAYEVFVHDDASTDKTAAIIKEYEMQYPDIIIPVYQKENQYSKGVKITNDILLPKTRGQYFAFCEGDDFWTDPNKLQKQVDFLDAHPEYVACVHNSVVHDCTGKEKDHLHVALTEAHDVTFEMVIKGMAHAYQTSALVVRRDVCFDLPDFYDVAVTYGFGDWPRAIWFTLQGKIWFFSDAMSTYRLMSNPNAWSVGDAQVARRLHNYEGIIAMMNATKKHVDHNRAGLVDQEIRKYEFQSLLLREQYRELRKPPYYHLWKQLSITQKVKTLLKQYCSKLYHFYRDWKR